MKNKFAYLFESGNFQLLAKKSECEDTENPKISLITTFDDVEIDLGFIFKDGSYESRDRAFDNKKNMEEVALKYLEILNDSESLEDFISKINS